MQQGVSTICSEHLTLAGITRDHPHGAFRACTGVHASAEMQSFTAHTTAVSLSFVLRTMEGVLLAHNVSAPVAVAGGSETVRVGCTLSSSEPLDLWNTFNFSANRTVHAPTGLYHPLNMHNVHVCRPESCTDREFPSLCCVLRPIAVALLTYVPLRYLVSATIVAVGPRGRSVGPARFGLPWGGHSVNAALTLDQANVTAGFRTTGWGAKFRLNHREMQLRGFSHHDNFAGVGVAMPARVFLFHAQASRALGGNFWRVSSSVAYWQ
jgi:hypothetical protein